MPFQTPDAPTDELVCWRFSIPRDLNIRALFMGALSTLARVANWEQRGDMTPLETASLFSDILGSQKESPCMIGAIIPAVWTTPPSSSYILCDGHTELRQDYPRLYALLPSSLILDSDTFSTPDLRGKILLGAGFNAADDVTYSALSDYGTNSEALSVEQLPAHHHAVVDHTHTSPPHSHTDLGHTHGYGYPTFNLDLEAPGAPDIFGAGNPPIPSVTTVGSANLTSDSVSIDAAGAQDTSDTGEGATVSKMQLSTAFNYYLIGD